MSNFINISEYRNWLEVLKMRIKGSQIRAALSVNRELILLYWDLGKQISEKQKTAEWGNSVINQLSQDLCNAFEGTAGFSKSNLYAMKNFYEFFHQLGGKFKLPVKTLQITNKIETNEIVHQVGGQLESVENVEVVEIDNEIYLPEKIRKEMPSAEELNNELLGFEKK